MLVDIVDDSDELVSGVLTDFDPVAIHDLAERPLPPGGLWDPTYPPIPDPPPTPLHWNVCFSDAGERDRAADAIRHLVPGVAIEAVDLPDEDWAARSQQSLTAVRAGRYIIAPPWDLPQEPVDATVIVIEPSMGFGTGHHATTRMCLRLLGEIDVSDQTVLDLGTGSGVLSMAAALGGARRVVGIDVDADAIGSAEASARLNTLPDTIAFRVADFRTAAAGARRHRPGQPHRRDADHLRDTDRGPRASRRSVDRQRIRRRRGSGGAARISRFHGTGAPERRRMGGGRVRIERVIVVRWRHDAPVEDSLTVEFVRRRCDAHGVRAKT